MNEEKEDPILKAPESEKEQESLVNNIESTGDEKEKSTLNYEQRRISLLNNPNYGVVLCFLDKFRAQIDIQDYPLHVLEENLLSDHENISRQLIDFHLTLLKRISLGKGAKRDKFVSIITKFAYRFDYDDGEYLKANGYSQAQIDTKLRILKNLLETQFDHNQAFKSVLVEKQSFEVRSQPFGRDRSGAAYWLFMDSECFIRIFREETDDDRGWVNIVKDKDDFEKLIVLLITDNAVRKKFPEWKFAHEPFNSLSTSTEFQERYLPYSIQVKKEVPIDSSKQQSSASSMPLDPIKIENNILVCPKKAHSPATVKNEAESDHESSTSADKNGQRSRVTSSNDTNPAGSSQEEKQEINNNQVDEKMKKARGRRKSSHRKSKKRRTTSSPSKKEDQEQELPMKTTNKGRKRKQITDQEDNALENDQNNVPSQEIEPTPMDEESINDDNLPIALRRSRRIRKVPTNELPSITSSPVKSVSQTPTKKKFINGKCKTSSQSNVKVSSQSSKTKGNRKRGRRGGKSSMNGISSSSDEQQPSEDEEDEYNSDDYLPDKNQLEEFDDEELVEEAVDEYVPRRSAKTVAKRRGQMTNDNVEESSGPASACCVCSKTDRPESLLLCDDCDDPYHLECLKPVLLAVPDGDWYCPICEHKRLSESFIGKFVQLIKEYEELEIKRNQCMSKRSNRLANVMLNLDRMVKRSSEKRRTNGIVDSDDENEVEEEEERKTKSDDEEEEELDDGDDESVYGFKDDDESYESKPKSKRSTNSSKRLDRDETQKSESQENLGVRSCRRKPQNYRFDDYDKKMKEAMMVDGEVVDEIEKDSGESDEEIKKSTRRVGYEKDEDFDTSENKNDDEFAPDPDRSEDSESEEAEEEFDDESSDDAWKTKRRSSTKKKQSSKSTRRKSKRKSDGDDSLSDAELSNMVTFDTTKSETTTDMDLNDIGNDDRRRSARATTQKSYAKQQQHDSEDEDDDLTNSSSHPPPRRMRYRKRRGSDDSFIEDDDYEKLARKREIVKYGKNIGRSSITDHIKKLVEEDETSQTKPTETSPKPTVENVEEVENEKANNSTTTNNADEAQPSDDDDFPDEQEIFKANGLLNLKKNINGPQPVGFRPAFMAPTHSYQHAIIDPTARFAMIRPAAVRPAINNGLEERQ